MSTVDIVVPCYNYGRFLGRCIDSILSQEGVDVRVLIIDDASLDDTQELAEQLANIDSRIEFRRHAINQGHIATYNEGLLGWALADYSLLLSADDALAPGALKRATNFMNQYCEVGMTYGRALIIDNDGPSEAFAKATSGEFQIVSSARFLQRCFEIGNPVPTPTAVVRTKLQHKLGGYRADLPHTGDMEMWMRFAANSPIGVCDNVQAYYRMHGGNMSRQYFAQILSDRCEVIQACEQFVENCGEKFSQINNWRNTLMIRLGEEAFWLASHAFDAAKIREYKDCLAFAENVNPKLRGSAKWWRLRAKGLLGTKLWTTVRPTINYLRNLDDNPPCSELSLYTRVGIIFGWWPSSQQDFLLERQHDSSF